MLIRYTGAGQAPHIRVEGRGKVVLGSDRQPMQTAAPAYRCALIAEALAVGDVVEVPDAVGAKITASFAPEIVAGVEIPALVERATERGAKATRKITLTAAGAALGA
jgi:hypothetical protein